MPSLTNRLEFPETILFSALTCGSTSGVNDKPIMVIVVTHTMKRLK
jgi:hypothetical protein